MQRGRSLSSPLDELNKNIVKMLQRDGRIPFKEIVVALDVSEGSKPGPKHEMRDNEMILEDPQSLAKALPSIETERAATADPDRHDVKYTMSNGIDLFGNPKTKPVPSPDFENSSEGKRPLMHTSLIQCKIDEWEWCQLVKTDWDVTEYLRLY